MSAFDKIIGYKSIKEELEQICDMIKNPVFYERLGAKLPRGVLLSGDPGLGKTLMAKCLIEESGLKCFTIRRNRGNDDFVEAISDTFEEAKEQSPCIIFLDDMDKFANEDENHADAEEYVAIQSGIDDVKEYDVFVVATVNNMRKLPGSLTRAGRFDRKIDVYEPDEEDAKEIISHFLSDKKIAADVDMEDLTRMISYSSCAELETILNEAAIYAAFERKKFVEMADMVKAVLRMQYDAPDDYARTSGDDLRRIALHEAGHLVACEVLDSGSVGLASLRVTGHDEVGGFVHRCKELKRRAHDIIISLAGKAAVELYYSETCASGCKSDISNAFKQIRNAISNSGTNGFGMIDVSTHQFPDTSESLNARNEAVTQAEMERYLFKARDILLKNRAFLERAADELMEKKTLLYSDIQRIEADVEIVRVEV